MSRKTRLSRIKIERDGDGNFHASACVHDNNKRRMVTAVASTGKDAADALLKAADTALVSPEDDSTSEH